MVGMGCRFMWYGWNGLQVVPTAQDEGVSELTDMYGAKRREQLHALGRPDQGDELNWTCSMCRD